MVRIVGSVLELGGSILSLATTTITHLCTSQLLGLLCNQLRNDGNRRNQLFQGLLPMELTGLESAEAIDIK